VLVGSSAPAEEIVEGAATTGAAAVILAAVTDYYDTAVLNEMARVRRGVSQEVPVLFGGKMPPRLVEDIIESGLVLAKDMKELRQRLEAITA
jgi:methylmalonyl-CoA mutase cobalamin-binding subunit